MSGPLITNVRAPRVRPVPIKTIYVRNGGSDSARGDVANPLATLQAALDRVPTVIDDAYWRIDVTGYTDAGGSRFFFPPKISSLPAEVQLAGGLFLQDLSLAPVTIVAVPTVYATLTVTGQSNDAVHTLLTINTSNSFTLNELRGKFIRGANLGEYGTIVSNTAGPNSQVVVSTFGTLTGPVQVLDASCTLDLGDPAENFNYSCFVESQCVIAFTGIKFRATNTPLGAALSTKQAQLYFQFCDVQGIYAETGAPLRFDGCYFHDGILSLNGASHAFYQSYLRRVNTNFHGDGSHGGHGYFWSVIEECGPLGHHNNFQADGGFDISECNIVNPKVDGAGAGAATNGVLYRGGPHGRVRNTRINGASIGVLCEGPGYMYMQNVHGTNVDVGVELRDGAQVKRVGGTAVTGGAGDVRLGSAGVVTWASAPATDLDQLVRIS